MEHAESPAQPTWSWRNLDNLQANETNEEPPVPRDGDQPGTQNREDAHQGPPDPMKYPPRTCRICLEEVLPSFEPSPEGLSARLRPAAKVRYLSSDPTSGRLIRPCTCRGTQAFVHEGCLQEWRHADKQYGVRNYWECPTCKFSYRLERMKWSRYITSPFTQLLLTVIVLVFLVFLAGFVANPILALWFGSEQVAENLHVLSSLPLDVDEAELLDIDGWTMHFVKGVASLGLLSFVQAALFFFNPWNLINIRNNFGGGGRGRRRGRVEFAGDLMVAFAIAYGFLKFVQAIWKMTRAWTLRTLEKASERVLDVQEDDAETGHAHED